MKLKITKTDNNMAFRRMQKPNHDICKVCPTAIAFCRATKQPIGDVSVGYSLTYGEVRSKNKKLFILPPDLLHLVQQFTRHVPRPPILGTFELIPVQAQTEPKQL